MRSNEAIARNRRGSAPDGPTLFDLANPLELRVEPIAAAVEAQIAAGIEAQDDAATRERELNEERSVEAKVDDITAELVRLLEQGEAPAQNRDVPDEIPISPIRKAE